MRVACILFTHEIQLAEFAEACLRLSPQIALREPNILFIEIYKCRHLYSEQSFLARIQLLLRRFNSKARIEISNTLPCALSFALWGLKMPHPLALDALPIDALCDFTDPFASDPPGRKAIQKMIESLKRLGIHDFGQFKTLPTHQLPSRFGRLGLFCHQQIQQIETQGTHLPWPDWKPPEILSERLEFLSSEFCSQLEPLLFKAKEVLDRIFSRLRGKLLRADRIRLALELEKYSTVKTPLRTWTFELIAPQGSTQGFLPILRERLNEDLQKIPIESQAIALTIEILSTSNGRASQTNLFHSREEFTEAMSSFFGEMEEFLGKGHVFWATLTEERFPEKSWIKKRNPEQQKIDLEGRYPKRPTRIFKSPLPMTVVQNHILLKGRSYLVKRWSCVERLSLGWLDQTPPRNYYCVDLENRTTLWVFTDPGHHYFLHGYYE